MKSIINILSPEVINQIAAGEVIQRPASVIKELIENSIDAKSQSIEIIIENAGKKLIKIIDDGSGMSEQDAKICFQKHSTSKITSTEDIMQILTMGFRGEALSSIASIADVELQTKTKFEDIGTIIHIDNSNIKNIKKTASNTGTSISVKNLFFNIPARKNFLKSDQIEMKHILEVFTQIAIAHHKVAFKIQHNGKIIYNLTPTNTKQRIIQIFGKRYNQKILPIKEETSIVKISGFLGNPIESKKTRGEQFLYVNNRFIKSSYLNHAIKSSVQDIITKDQHPSYFIFMHIAPDLIDVNIHPNKIEVKFEDEKAIYQILKSACKRSIGMNNITPSLDFTTEESFEIPVYNTKSIPKEPKIKINTSFNPFEKNIKRAKENTENIDKLFNDPIHHIIENIMNIDSKYAVFTVIQNNIRTLNIIDKKRSLQRIKYEEVIERLTNQEIALQKMTTPLQININQIDIELIKENRKLIQEIGYEISEIKNNYIKISSMPNELKEISLEELFELFLEQLKNNNTKIKSSIIHETALKIIRKIHVKQNNIDNQNSLTELIKKTLNCQNPFIGVDGAPCIINIEPNNFFD